MRFSPLHALALCALRIVLPSVEAHAPAAPEPENSTKLVGQKRGRSGLVTRHCPDAWLHPWCLLFFRTSFLLRSSFHGLQRFLTVTMSSLAATFR
jgi:hypothetical protein